MDQRKMLLLSLELEFVRQFIEISPESVRLAFVPTAGTPYDDQSFVTRDREFLVSMGFRVVDVPLEGQDQTGLRRQLQETDAIFVAGGNTFYLLQQARKSGFDGLVAELVNEGTPYIGASAGAVLVGPSIAPAQNLDDPAAAPGLTDFTGLGLIDFVVLPHYGNPKYEATYTEIIHIYRDRYRLIPLKDDQAIRVTDREHEIISRSG